MPQAVVRALPTGGEQPRHNMHQRLAHDLGGAMSASEEMYARPILMSPMVRIGHGVQLDE